MRRISFPLESVSLSGGSQSHQMALSGKKEIYLGLHLEEGRKSLALREISLSSCFQRSLSVSSAISFTLIFFLLSGLLLELHNRKRGKEKNVTFIGDWFEWKKKSLLSQILRTRADKNVQNFE